MTDSQFDAELLELPADDAARRIALAYLDDAAGAAERLTDAADAEALHDFRVAIRRLRVTLRTYPQLTDVLSKKQRAKLRKLARHTNPARDAEVQMAWLQDRKKKFTSDQRKELERFRARLRAQRRRRLASTQRKLQRWFTKLDRKVRRRLKEKRAAARRRPFRTVAAAALVGQARELDSRLQSTIAHTSPADLHATRIAAKRLRYLLEPVAPGVHEGGQALARLRALQELLGALTDGHELETALQEQEHGDATDAALTMLRGEAGEVFAKLRQEWPDAGPDLVRRIERIARELRPPAGNAIPVPPSMRQRPRHRRHTTA